MTDQRISSGIAFLKAVLARYEEEKANLPFQARCVQFTTGADRLNDLLGFTRLTATNLKELNYEMPIDPWSKTASYDEQVERLQSAIDQITNHPQS